MTVGDPQQKYLPNIVKSYSYMRCAFAILFAGYQMNIWPMHGVVYYRCRGFAFCFLLTIFLKVGRCEA